MKFQNRVHHVTDLPEFNEAAIKAEPMYFKGSAIDAMLALPATSRTSRGN